MTDDVVLFVLMDVCVEKAIILDKKMRSNPLFITLPPALIEEV